MKSLEDKANLFLKSGKYEKAIAIYKKLSNKDEGVDSLERIAFCYYKNGQHQLAKDYYYKVLAKVTSSSHKIALLTNIAHCEIGLKNDLAAMKVLIEVVHISDTVETFDHRFELCVIANKLNLHEEVFKYGGKLLSTVSYSDQMTLLMTYSTVSIDTKKTNEFYNEKLFPKIINLPDRYLNDILAFFKEEKKEMLINSIRNALGSRVSKFSLIDHPADFKSKKNNAKRVSLPSGRVIGDNNEIIELVENLIKYSESNGAYFHPNLRVYESNGDLSVKVLNFDGEADRLMDIPLKCMPIMDDFEFKLSDNKIQLITSGKPINPLGCQTMSYLIDIYNKSNKIASWCKSFPFIALKNTPKLLDLLVKGKENVDKVRFYYSTLKDDNIQALTVLSFFGSRAFSYSKTDLAVADIKIDTAFKPGLLSIIDFLNHKTKSNYYSSSNGRLMVSGLPSESGELFVHYNNFDALMTYLIYGFVDIESPILFSVPIQLELLNKQKVEVEGSNDLADDGRLSQAVKHLKRELPNVVFDNGIFKVNKIIIPTGVSIEALRDVLKIIVKSILKNNNEDLLDSELMGNVLHFEKQIITKNYAYWMSVKRELQQCEDILLAENKQAYDSVFSLIDSSENILKGYMSKMGVTLF